ncbi:helix-turn-helix transcriptional regulator [Flavobacterium sp. xlx-214]|uniref:AraC family transcriptional regulator n=1 Tax=unclassified Flavobacterium TaxID=196869 RepID=UPI0013D07C3F|nr:MULTISPECIES: AraC family transcriptional regulator [unclassified Flavobacterium]MBA5793955.1 helix-turn-helix transcriptional regulator [Flavobacterium sp. xlx-221]QMI82674.1 helix-turn-helix transcriptional regulator [Flavobacterium sp. xlx-214]
MKTLRIKNMVCPRCIMAVEKTMEDLGFDVNDVELGLVEFHEPITLDDRNKIEAKLVKLGFEILEDKKSQTVERIKNQIIELVSKDLNDLTITLSEYLSSKLQTEYNALSTLFSNQESQTIEQFYILQKIEKVKELLVYDELNLNEIAYKMNYSSAAHLSSQFKKITGLSPTHFKEVKLNKEEVLENKKHAE